MDLHAWMDSEGIGATGQTAGMELGPGLAVLGDHQPLAAG